MRRTTRPELPSGRDVEFQSVDLRNEKAARAAFEPVTGITHIAYTALHEKPELVEQGTDRDQERASLLPANGFAYSGYRQPPLPNGSLNAKIQIYDL